MDPPFRSPAIRAASASAVDEGHSGLRRQNSKREALLKVQLYAGRGVIFVADGEVSAHHELEIPAALTGDHCPSNAGRPDELAGDQLPHVLEHGIATGSGRAREALVTIGTQRDRI